MRTCVLSTMGHQCTTRPRRGRQRGSVQGEEPVAWGGAVPGCPGQPLSHSRAQRTKTPPPSLSGGIQPGRFRRSHPLLSVFSFCILGPKVQRELPLLFSAEELGWNWGEQGEGGGQPGELPT